MSKCSWIVYIVNILALMCTQGEDHALDFCSSIKHSNCEIVWSSVDSQMTFHDLTMFFEGGWIKHKLFRKRINYFECLL